MNYDLQLEVTRLASLGKMLNNLLEEFRRIPVSQLRQMEQVLPLLEELKRQASWITQINDLYTWEIRDRIQNFDQTTEPDPEEDSAPNKLSPKDPPTFDHVVVPNRNRLKVRRDALEVLRKFASSADELVLVDPYFYGGEALAAASYVEDLIRATGLRRTALRKLTVIFNSKAGNTSSIIKKFKAACSDHRINLNIFDTDVIHDRFWIANKSKGILIGTSLGGLGKKLCFITNMDPFDLSETIQFLEEQKLLA